MKKATEVSLEPSIHITWSGDSMKHPDIAFTGRWDHRQIRALPQEINLAFTKHITQQRIAGIGANPTNEEGE